MFIRKFSLFMLLIIAGTDEGSAQGMMGVKTCRLAYELCMQDVRVGERYKYLCTKFYDAAMKNGGAWGNPARRTLPCLPE